MGKLHKIRKAFNRLSDDEKRTIGHRRGGGYFGEDNRFRFDVGSTKSYRKFIIKLFKDWEQEDRLNQVLDSVLPEIYKTVVTQPTLSERLVFDLPMIGKGRSIPIVED